MAPDYQDLLQARIKQLEQQLAAVREERDKLLALIGEAPEGSHPDEWLPRDSTWHKERANWLREVERGREYANHLRDAIVKAASLRNVFGDQMIPPASAVAKVLADVVPDLFSRASAEELS